LINDFDEALDFQRKQQEASMIIGAYLVPLKDFLERAESDLTYADDINNLRRLVHHVENKDFFVPIHTFFNKYGYESYQSQLSANWSTIKIKVVNQTLPSTKARVSHFVDYIKTSFKLISECQIALAQIPLPKVEFSIKAQTPLQAFCFFSHFFSTVTEHLYIVDPYIDLQLGGSLKDAAKKSPFSVVTLSDQRRSELIKEYFS